MSTYTTRNVGGRGLRFSSGFDPSEDRPETGNDLCYPLPEPLGQCVWDNFDQVGKGHADYDFLRNNCQISIERTIRHCRCPPKTLTEPPCGSFGANCPEMFSDPRGL